jgi:hypothetical protein
MDYQLRHRNSGEESASVVEGRWSNHFDAFDPFPSLLDAILTF